MLTLSDQIDHEAHQIDFSLLERVLSPYSPAGTDYLKSMQLEDTCQCASSVDDAPLFVSSGAYQIPTSCYIQDTGHFNAVEFLICYNQLAYATFAHLVEGEYFNMPEFTDACPKISDALEGMSIEHYFKHQLSSMLILKTETRFKSIINAKDFYGTLTIKKLKRRKDTIFIETKCVFRDDDGGYAEGNVLLAYQPKFN